MHEMLKGNRNKLPLLCFQDPIIPAKHRGNSSSGQYKNKMSVH